MSTRTSATMPARGNVPGGGPARAEPTASSSGGRRRFGLRDVRIRSKLGVLLIIPMVAIAGLTAARFVDSGKRALSAQLVSSLTALSGDIAGATHELQRERVSAAAVLSGENDSGPAFNHQVAVTKAAINTYSTHRRNLGRLPAALNERLNHIDQQLSIMESLREQVRAISISVGEVVARYAVVINDMVGYHSLIVQYASDARLADSMRAVAAFAQAKAHAADEQAIGFAALKPGRLDQQQYSSFVATLTGQESALQAFELNASTTQASLVDSAISGDAVQLADQVAQQVGRSVSTDATTTTLQVTAEDFARSVGAVVDLMRWAEQRLDGQLTTDAKALQNSVIRQVAFESGLVLVAIALALLVAFLIARGLSRSLSRLREGALRVVSRDLPGAVARLRDLREIGETTPDEIAQQLPDPVRIDSRDEIGQVAQAFNAVHREAVRVAAEQAGLRTSVSAMFLNLARRSQALVDRMIGELDTIERGEEDPKRLAQLFQLDHLATRMRRNDENLLVLAGADSTAPRREDALVADVLRAAQSEVELYNRIEFGVVDLDVAVVSHAVNDVVRLVAELFDNATRFSPPESAVVADARRIGDYVLVQIEDRGLGMTPDQMQTLNSRLAEPPAVDVAAFRMMGLAVVSRLAGRYGIRVELRPNPDGGTITHVTLPTSVLVLPRLRGREPVITRPRAPLAVEQAPLAGLPPGRPMPQLPGLAAAAAPAGVITVDRPTFEVPLVSRPGADPLSSPAARPQQTPAPDPAEVPIYRSMEAVWFGGNGAEGAQAAYQAQAEPPPPMQPMQPMQPTYAPPPSAPTFAPPASARRPMPPPPPEAAQPAPPHPPAQTPSARPPLARRGQTPGGSWGAPPPEPAAPTGGNGGPNRGANGGTNGARPSGLSPDRTAPVAPPPPAPPPPARSYAAAGEPPYVPPGLNPPPIPPEPPGGALPPENGWRTSADIGWQAAAAAAEPPAAGTTRSGLPKRIPAAQLVPGGVEARTTTARTKRSPDDVRGLLSAYHRGVQRGRSSGEGASLEPRPDSEESSSS